MTSPLPRHRLVRRIIGSTTLFGLSVLIGGLLPPNAQADLAGCRTCHHMQPGHDVVLPHSVPRVSHAGGSHVRR
jgi:hypothetical protein